MAVENNEPWSARDKLPKEIAGSIDGGTGGVLSSDWCHSFSIATPRPGSIMDSLRAYNDEEAPSWARKQISVLAQELDGLSQRLHDIGESRLATLERRLRAAEIALCEVQRSVVVSSRAPSLEVLHAPFEGPAVVSHLDAPVPPSTLDIPSLASCLAAGSTSSLQLQQDEIASDRLGDLERLHGLHASSLAGWPTRSRRSNRSTPAGDRPIIPSIFEAMPQALEQAGRLDQLDDELRSSEGSDSERSSGEREEQGLHLLGSALRKYRGILGSARFSSGRPEPIPEIPEGEEPEIQLDDPDLPPGSC